MWYRIGFATSVTLRFMDPGYEWFQNLDIIYNHICIVQQDRINAITEKLQEIEWDKSSIQWLCKTILKQCRTDRELCTYAVVYLKGQPSYIR